MLPDFKRYHMVACHQPENKHLTLNIMIQSQLSIKLNIQLKRYNNGVEKKLFPNRY